MKRKLFLGLLIAMLTIGFTACGGTSKIDPSELTNADKMMAVASEYLSENGYEEFSCKKNDLNAVFIRGNTFTAHELNKDRTFTMYPDIFLWNLGEEPFMAGDFIFRMELRDTTEKQSDRYDLYADALTIKSGEEKIQIEYDGIPGGSDYESTYYTSRFDFDLSAEEARKLKEMATSGDVAFEMALRDNVTDYLNPLDKKYEKVRISYEFDESDIEYLKRALDLYIFWDDTLAVSGE